MSRAHFVKRVALGIAGLALMWGLPSPSSANQIVLEGSDATALHHDSTYTAQLFNFMITSNPTAPPHILVLGGVPLSGLPAGEATIAPGYSLTGFDLSNFAGLYIESIGGCCTQADHSISAADQATIAAHEALGLSLTIENYGGGPAWGPILPAAVDLLPSSDFGGITDFGTAGGPTCTDNEHFNAAGLADGFTQPPVLGCYEHQGYRTSAFTPLGFTSLVDADPAYFGADGSALLAIGGTIVPPTPGVPEPASMALFGSALAGLAFIRRRRKSA